MYRRGAGLIFLSLDAIIVAHVCRVAINQVGEANTKTSTLKDP